ncbi:class IV adenylate cyclase [Streptomyces sp. NBC_01304]|uniref:class IV adenylate cyclase n=1 Tax=Streptomyces sp. NBC_01304 TaxID=2903818 RepID=UPI002E113220|nr:CYTH domain-containing protein [Streptomyces sp. NBC_01304]
MRTEFEARFLEIDPSKITEYLTSQSAVCAMPRTLMRRIVFKNNYIEARGGWLRLRQQGERTFLTYKQVTSNVSAIDTTLEAEVEVGNFDSTKTLLEAMGFTALRYQENYREEWKLNSVAFDIDTWPDLPTFLEVEGPDENSVHKAAAALGLDVTQASYGTVDEVYLAVLGRDILAESELVFTA